MGKDEYRLLWNKLKPAIACPFFAAALFFAFGKPPLNIFESAGAILVGCFSAAIFYFTIRANIEGTDADFSNPGSPIALADRHADGFLFMVLIAYVFFLDSTEAFVRRALCFLALAAVPMYLGETLAVLLLERKVGNKIVITRSKVENILAILYAIAAIGIGMIIAFTDRFN